MARDVSANLSAVAESLLLLCFGSSATSSPVFDGRRTSCPGKGEIGCLDEADGLDEVDGTRRAEGLGADGGGNDNAKSASLILCELRQASVDERERLEEQNGPHPAPRWRIIIRSSRSASRH